MLKNNIFLTSILEGSGRRFGRVFGRIFTRKMHEHYQKKFAAKSLKITLPCRRERDIQESESDKQNKNREKIDEKTHVFCDIDFEGVLGGFGDGFGRSKSLIFAFFSRKNASKKQDDFWKAKKSHFEASRTNCGRIAAVRAGPGEGT